MRCGNHIVIMFWKLAVAVAFTVLVQNSEGQSFRKGTEPPFHQPKGYVTRFVKEGPVIDGNITEPVWEKAAWSDLFMDIEGDHKPVPPLKTKMKMLWNDSCLFVAAFLEEPHIWATLRKHDAIIYHDNDFEVFLDPDNNTHDYFEIEVNAYNTIFDLFLPKPYRNGGKAFISFELVSLKSAVKVFGTLNHSTDKDSGWCVEMAIPFRSVSFGNVWKAPEEGTIWRINFSRVQWDLDIIGGQYRKKVNSVGKPLPEHNWVWSPQGLINMHYPERWGYLQFTRNGEISPAFTLPYTEKQKQHLWSVYYRQKQYFSKNGKYAPNLQELGGYMASIEVDGKRNRMKVEATSRQFAAYISDDLYGWSINDEGQIKQEKIIQ
jgi:hypothetical protein